MFSLPGSDQSVFDVMGSRLKVKHKKSKSGGDEL